MAQQQKSDGGKTRAIALFISRIAQVDYRMFL
jgi:hypothetical protein